MNPKTDHPTFVDVVADHSKTRPKQKAYIHLGDNGHIRQVCDFETLHHQAKIIAGFLKEKTRPGDRALLIYSPGMPFIHALMGCLYAGVIAVPVFVPLNRDMADRLAHIQTDAEPGIILTDSFTPGQPPSNPDQPDTLDTPLPVDTRQLAGHWADNYRPLPLRADDVAYLQYTSGSTGYPKGVMVTHRNILSNTDMIQRFTGQQHAQSRMAGWLPHYHDMGLIGLILFPCFAGLTSVIMSPQRFMRAPLSWLKAISDFRCTITTAPDFAYERCIRFAPRLREEKLDLSCLQVAINGAEPVRAQTLAQFYDTFKPHGLKKNVFCPSFGLAEATVLAAGVKKKQTPAMLHIDKDRLAMGNTILPDPHGNALVGHGHTDTTQQMLIVHPESLEPCRPGEVGEIWLQGPSVCAGYWNNPKATRETFQARLKDGQGPFLRTGDLGFMHDGQLFVTGRLKDLIIIQGRNHYPQDIEAVVQGVSPKIRPDRVVAFSTETGTRESICIVAEYKGKPNEAHGLFGQINQRIGRAMGIKIDRLILIKPKTLLMTTSGKIRRKDTKTAYLQGNLEILASAVRPGGARHTGANAGCNEPATGTGTIKTMVARRLKLATDDIDETVPLGQYGFTSMDAAELAVELEALAGRPFSPTLLYENPTIQMLTEWVRGKPLSKPQKKKTRVLPGQQEPIAIIGMGCRFPGAPDLNAFWQLLEKGRDAVTPIPEDRPDLSNDMIPACRWGAFIDDATTFDAGFFNIPAAEAQWMDPQHRKLLEIVWTTVENAGYAPAHLAGSLTGVFIGISSQDYQQLISRHDPPAATYSATGLSGAMSANRISYLLDLHGPSETIDTACSSSLVAVHRAVQAIRHGECRQAIVGGVNLLFSPLGYIVLGKSGFLSPEGACKTFDARADGYVRGEGAGAIYLKPLSRALADNDHIHGLIKGSALYHGGQTASLTAPNENAQAALIRRAQRNAGVTPDTIAFVELHGTGTALGDPIEVNGLIKAFESRKEPGAGRPRKPFCAMGSVKTNIGHLEAAAGIAGLIKAALTLKHRTIPATLHCRQQNPLIRLERTPFYIATQPRLYRRKKGTSGSAIPLRAGVSAFGFGGTYAHVILEEPPDSKAGAMSSAHPVLLPLSAKTTGALMGRLQALYHDLYGDRARTSGPRPGLGDVAFTLQMGRDHYSHRIALIAGSHAQLKRLLSKAMATAEGDGPRLFTSPGRRDIQRRHDLEATARNWLDGEIIDWQTTPCRADGRRIPLTGYPFEKQDHWFAPLSSAGPGRQKRTGDPLPAAGHVSHRSHVSVEEVIQWLQVQASELLGIPAEEIDPDSTFEQLQLDSMALINIHDRMQDHFGVTLPVSIIQDYPNIRTLARRVAIRETYEPPDFYQEVTAQVEKLHRLLNRLPQKGAAASPDRPDRSVLLTGATGFLGAFLLSKLLHHTDAHIYCLVRSASAEQGLARLQNAFREFQISGRLSEDRIGVVCGDLSRDRFGMAPETYDTMAHKVDSVFHSGAVVDWMKPYMSLKEVNVGGTAEAIAFCARGKAKSLHYISSLAVLPLMEGKNKWVEADLPEPEALSNGYAQSKWVAERLCVEARRYGLGVDIFRFDFVAGEVKTGAMKPTDFVVRLLKGCIQLGCIPAEEVNFDILSADHLSNVMVLLSGRHQYKTYHLINRQPFSTCDFTKVLRQFGHKIERIGFDAWKAMIQASPDCDLYPLHPFINHYSTQDLARYHASRIDNTNTLSALYDMDPDLITGQPSAHEVLTRVMHHFTRTGVMPGAAHRDLLQRQSRYWRQQLADAPHQLELPFKVRDKNDAPDLKEATFDIPGELARKLAELADRERLPVSRLLLAAFQILLARYCRQADIPVAVPLAVPAGGDKAVPMLRTAVIRTILTSGATFRSVLYYVQQMVNEAAANMDLPSDEIGRMLYPEHDGPDRILYDTMFVYTDPGGAWTDPVNGHPQTMEEMRRETAGFTLCLEKSEEKIQGTWIYRQHRFEETTLARMTRHFKTLLTRVAHHPDTDPLTVPIMEEEELALIVDTWNDTQKAYPAETCFHTLFSAHAARRPHAVALRADRHTMTYGELEQRSDLLAAYLQMLGVASNDLIGICADKSFELIIGLLAIFKAGGAYVPIEPTYPRARKEFMLADAGARIILTRSAEVASLPPVSADIIRLDTDWDRIAGQGARHLPLLKKGASSNLAYMIYTSGSTGQPKGLQVSHASLVNLMVALAGQMEITPDDCMLTCAALSFDLSVFELFYPLAHGAALALLPRAMAGDGQQLRSFLEENPITFMAASVPTWRLLAYAGWEGNPHIQLVNSGEALPYALAQTLVKWSKAAFNAYGPAEATVFTTVKRLEPDAPVTIGKTLPNYQVYIVDQHFNPMPVGAYGELYIGGHGVCRGYHNRPELNRERFIPNPIRPEISPTLYRTGDLACFREDGEIVFKGRMDTQIKLRGHRIELGEIEHALSQHAQVRSCVVIARHDPEQEPKLVAYIIPGDRPDDMDIHGIKQSLKAMLPAYMLPADYMLMAQFPATPGGKVDRNAFPMPGISRLTEAYEAPETTVEVQLSEIWQRILDLDRVGRHNHFLDLGGDSILGMKLLLEINATFHLNLTIQSLFENLTIAELAQAILSHQSGTLSARKIDYAAETCFEMEMMPAVPDRIADSHTRPAHLLLTGVTGFLGVYLLRALLDATDADIYCLVRADDPDAAMQRIREKMALFQLSNEADLQRIKPLAGDLGEPGLGLPPDLYNTLAQTIDAVYHCGSVVNFSFPYHFLKKSNVEGTKEIIRLCLGQKVKPLFYISTVGVFEQKGLFSGRDVGEDEPLPKPEGLFTGYTRSKWVAEKIVEAVRKKGFPITIFRPGSVMGHSKTGICNLDDLANVMLRVFNTMGAVPDIDFGVNGLPVDFVAETIVRLSLHPAAPGKNFHVVNDTNVSVKSLIDYYQSFGYPAPLLPFDQWLAALKKSAETHDFLLPYIPVIEHTITELGSGAYPNFLLKNTKALIAEYPEVVPAVDEKLFHTYLQYLERVGFISRPGEK